jgi:hypothetical protein
VLNTLSIDSTQRNSTIFQHVNSEVVSQFDYLFFGKWSESKHSSLLCNKLPILDVVFEKVFKQEFSHLRNSVSHFFNIDEPLFSQLRIFENSFDQIGSIPWIVGVDLSDNLT